MFSISAKSTYGLLAMLDLAEYYGKGLVQIKDIVKRRTIPRNYLEQILNTLTKHSIINGVRGSNGGYELRRHPNEITLLDVFEAIEGRIQINESIEITAMQSLFKDLENNIRDFFKITLSDLVQRQHDIELLIDFQI